MKPFSNFPEYSETEPSDFRLMYPRACDVWEILSFPEAARV
jgi:hypothetical protein